MTTLSPTPCKTCGDRILFPRHIRTGKPHPVNADPVPGGGFQLHTMGGELVISKNRDTDAAGYVSHFATCTTPEAHRRPRTASPVQIPPLPHRVGKSALIAEVTREVTCSTGEPQTDDYVDITGAPTGDAVCAVCGRAVVVAYHENRRDGRAPLVLDAHRSPELGGWLLYRHHDASDVLAVYSGRDDPRAQFINHRLICPTTHIRQETP